MIDPLLEVFTAKRRFNLLLTYFLFVSLIINQVIMIEVTHGLACAADEVQQLGVRLRLYGCERMRREKMVGEVIVPFASINLTLGNTFWLTLEPRANLAVSIICTLHTVR